MSHETIFLLSMTIPIPGAMLNLDKKVPDMVYRNSSVHLSLCKIILIITLGLCDSLLV